MDTDNLRGVQYERVHYIVLDEQSQAGIGFVIFMCPNVIFMCPKHPSGGMCLVYRVSMMGLFHRNVCLAMKELISMKSAHHGPSGVFLLTKN